MIALENNIGKSGAVLVGLKKIKYEHVLLFDADLLGVELSDLVSLINIYTKGFDLAIMDYGAQGTWSKKIACSIPALSGVRLLKSEELKNMPIHLNDKFKLETRINDYMINHGRKIIVSPASTVKTPYKTDKSGLVKGTWLILKSIGDVYFANGLFGSLRNWRRWRRISRMV